MEIIRVKNDDISLTAGENAMQISVWPGNRCQIEEAVHAHSDREGRGASHTSASHNRTHEERGHFNFKK